MVSLATKVCGQDPLVKDQHTGLTTGHQIPHAHSALALTHTQHDLLRRVQSNSVDRTTPTSVPLITESVNPGAIALTVVLGVVDGLGLGLGRFDGGQQIPVAAAENVDLAIGTSGDELAAVGGKDEGGRSVDVVVESAEMLVAAGKRDEGGERGFGREDGGEGVEVDSLVGGGRSENALARVGSSGGDGECPQRRGVGGEEEGIGEGSVQLDFGAGGDVGGLVGGLVGGGEFDNEAVQRLLVGSGDDLEVDSGAGGRSSRCGDLIGGGRNRNGLLFFGCGCGSGFRLLCGLRLLLDGSCGGSGDGGDLALVVGHCVGGGVVEREGEREERSCANE